MPTYKSSNYCELHGFRMLQLPKHKLRKLLQKLTHSSINEHSYQLHVQLQVPELHVVVSGDNTEPSVTTEPCVLVYFFFGHLSRHDWVCGDWFSAGCMFLVEEIRLLKKSNCCSKFPLHPYFDHLVWIGSYSKAKSVHYYTLAVFVGLWYLNFLCRKGKKAKENLLNSQVKIVYEQHHSVVTW